MLLLALLLLHLPHSALAEPRARGTAAEEVCGIGQTLSVLFSPEIEAKLTAKNSAVLRKIKKLENTKITIVDALGQNRTYKVKLNKEHIYQDVYYDIYTPKNQLPLYQRRGMLRARTRYDKKPGERKFRLAKLVLQAKNGPTEIEGISTAIYARNEVRGLELKSKSEFESLLAEKLKRGSDDPAVQYAYGLIKSTQGIFVPVLESPDKRFFFKLSPLGKDKRDLPSFYLSLDRVKNTGLVGAKRSGKRNEVEIEIIEDITQKSQKQAGKKTYLLNEITEYFEKNYQLTPSPESKYEGGVIDGIL